MNFTESIKKIDANEIDYSFESFKKVEEAIQKHEFNVFLEFQLQLQFQF